MAPLAEELSKGIAEALSGFGPEAIDQYQTISGGRDNISIQYLSDLVGVNVSELYATMIPQEIKARRPLVGVQRDDYDFVINDRSLRKYGSQGQIKTFLYALRIAEFNYLRKRLNRTPIIILDDFFEKLDRSRLSSLLSLINGDDFGQVFPKRYRIIKIKRII